MWKKAISRFFIAYIQCEKRGSAMKLLPPDGWKECKGIFVFGCVKRGEDSMFRASAHAHNYDGSPVKGWICFRGLRKVGEVLQVPIMQGDEKWDGAVLIPSKTLWHEYAHLLTKNQGHTDKWREKMRELGQPIPLRYRRKKRRKSWIFINTMQNMTSPIFYQKFLFNEIN